MSPPPLLALRRPRRERDDPPLEVLDALWRTPAGFGADLALSRAVPADDGRTLHVVAGERCVGLFEATGTGELFSPEELRAGAAVVRRVEAPGRLRVQGLVPDDVVGVRVRLRDGALVRVALSDGVYDVVLECAQEGDEPVGLLLEAVGAQLDVPLACTGDDLLGALA